MGLAWQQGPIAPGAIGRFLVPAPLPERLLSPPTHTTQHRDFGPAAAWSSGTGMS
jgi:hypothetical protein